MTEAQIREIVRDELAKLTGTVMQKETITYPVLSVGDSGSDVAKLQQALIAAGYSCGSYGADGEFGSATEAAVRAYQAANGLSVDGIAGQETQEHLYG